MEKKYNSGFTIVELMVTIALLGILAAWAAPGFENIVRDNRQATQINDFVSSVQMARSEAIKRGASVTLCTSADGVSCSGAAGWQQGWLVFIDLDDDTVVDAGETVINVGSGLDGGNTLFGNANVSTSVVFDSRGFSRGFNGTFTLCDERGSDKARGLVLSNTGRIRRTVDEDSDGIEEGPGGAALVCA